MCPPPRWPCARAIDAAALDSAAAADEMRVADTTSAPDSRKSSVVGGIAVSVLPPCSAVPRSVPSGPDGTDLGTAEQGGRTDTAMPPTTLDLRESGADVVSATRISSAAAAESSAAASMARAQGHLGGGHILAPLGDNASESYRE